MKWMVSVNELDAVQSRAIENIVKNRNTNHWVKGFAGSGKTVVLTHVLERLATQEPSVSICFATYTHALKDLVESGLTPNAKDSIDISTFNGLRNLRTRYDVIVVDEMQDIPRRILPQLTKRSDVLVIAADHDQSIYRFASSSFELSSVVNPAKEHQLREIHRVNENIFLIATSVYSQAVVPERATVRVDDEQTHVYEGTSMADEFVTMFTEATRVSSKGHPSAILLPSKALIDHFITTISRTNSYVGVPPSVKDAEPPEVGEQADPFRQVNAYLKSNKSPLQVFGSGSGSLYDSDTQKVVYLMTYHSAKGLDFANVFLPHLTDGTSLEPMKGATDDQERRLFFVAVTRARERLYLSYHDEPHRFLDKIPRDLVQPFRKQKRTY